MKLYKYVAAALHLYQISLIKYKSYTTVSVEETACLYYPLSFLARNSLGTRKNGEERAPAYDEVIEILEWVH